MLHGTATARSDFVNSKLVTVYKGHKYLLKAWGADRPLQTGTNNPDANVRLYDTVKEEYIADYCSTAEGVFFQVNETSSNIQVRITAPTTSGAFVDGYTYTLSQVKCTPQLYDLTLMFGATNEPSTLDEFNKILPAWYSEYDLGTVVTTPAQITVTSRGANLFNINSVRGERNDLGIKDPYGPGMALGSASSCFTTMQEDTYYEGLAYNAYYNFAIDTAFDVLSNNTARSGSYSGYGTGFPIRIVPGQRYFLKYEGDLEDNGGFIGLT
ncbi:MAG: hypothetical protein IJ371_03785 [Clostridia bacterium]|nr:hypothetical protein [Clostridia bacterium]